MKRGSTDRVNRRTTGPATVRPAAVQAASLRHTREVHAGEVAEDYVEAIADLGVSRGEARVVDLARRLGVTHVTVNRTVARLQQAGLVTSEPYRAIFLTDKGQKLATLCKERHETVAAFLRSLGIPENVSERDAEGIEHHVSQETLAAFKAALRTARRRAPAPGRPRARGVP